MAQLDYSVNKPSNIMPGLQMLSKGIDSRQDYNRKLAAANKEKELRKQAYDIMQTGTPEQVDEFITKNPGGRKIFEDVAQFKSEATKNNAVDTAKKILLEGAEVGPAMIERAQLVMTEGGDSKETIESAQRAVQDPEKGRDWAMKVLQLYEPATYKTFVSGGQDTGTKVGSQEFLEDGTLIQSTPKGPVVYNPQQQIVTGQAAADAIKAGRAEKVSNIRKAAGGRKRAALTAELELKGKVAAGVINQKEAAKISVKAYERLEGINQNIDNLDEGIKLLRTEGANTGFIDKYLPNLKKSTMKLKNLQGRLGLDILRNTTFGALSASELAFALDTAFPEGLQPKDAADWLEERKNAQEKLSDYIESAAIYLGTPGNTVTGWIKKKKAEREQKTTSPPLQDFLQKARASNPGVSDQDLTDYYNKKYGGM